MAHFDLTCKDCGHRFELVTGGAIRKKQKRCKECGSENIRQSLLSYLQNGPLSSPTCGEQRPSSGYG
jgi:putative FmdB family regulatory protein